MTWRQDHERPGQILAKVEDRLRLQQEVLGAVRRLRETLGGLAEQE